MKEDLKLQSNDESVHVKFDGPNDVLPMTPAMANQVKLVMSVNPFDGYYKQEGLYTDTITAEVIQK